MYIELLGIYFQPPLVPGGLAQLLTSSQMGCDFSFSLDNSSLNKKNFLPSQCPTFQAAAQSLWLTWCSQQQLLGKLHSWAIFGSPGLQPLPQCGGELGCWACALLGCGLPSPSAPLAPEQGAAAPKNIQKETRG